MNRLPFEQPDFFGCLSADSGLSERAREILQTEFPRSLILVDADR